MGALPDHVTRYLSTHLQLVTRRRLLSLGCGRGTISGWVRRGHLVQVERGVYTLPGVELTFAQRVYARVLRCGDDAVAGPFATLALHGIEGFEDCLAIDVWIDRDREVVVTDCTPADLPATDRSKHRRVVPTLSVARALLEVASIVSRKRLRVAFDDAGRRRLLSVDYMRRRALDLPDHPGAEVFLELLGGGALGPESEGEREMQVFLAKALPDEHIEWQVDDLVPGRRLDAVIRRVLIAFEYDGREYHVDREADYLRDLQSSADGVVIIRLTRGMLRHEREETKALVRAVIAERELLLARR